MDEDFKTSENLTKPARLQSRKLILNRFTGSKEVNFLIKAKLNLDIEVEKVVDLEIKILDLKEEIIQEQLLITASVIYRFSVLKQSGKLKYLEERGEFQKSVYLSDLSIDTEILNQLQIKGWDFINGKNLLLLTVFVANLTLYRPEEVTVYTAQQGKLIKTKERLKTLNKSWLIEDCFTLGIIYRQLVELHSRVVKSKVKIIADQAIVSGQLSFELYYIDQNGQEKRLNLKSQFNKLLSLSSVEGANTNFEYRLEVIEIKAMLKNDKLILRPLLKIVSSLQRQLLVKVATKQKESLKKLKLDCFLVDRVLINNQQKLLLINEMYLTRYAKQIQELRVKIDSYDQQLLASAFLLECRLKYTIQFIDQQGTVQQMNKEQITEQLISLKNKKRELEGSKLNLSIKVSPLDFELSHSGEEIVAKTALEVRYCLFKKERVTLLIKN
ncbi:hypothetical protein [Fuchsiella alkaliacetigena]|uniref:hypothetical protein n=1 Tax=Fuchsiella alkaliacetigena TaxID=957042 RepID=UPI00200B72A6|nr:hypothetical protein [Fuchsiella alkaliacetigena]MCK8824981.1 hypothetical protein [Fuchsiella alkaliacetigena]